MGRRPKRRIGKKKKYEWKNVTTQSQNLSTEDNKKTGEVKKTDFTDFDQFLSTCCATQLFIDNDITDKRESSNKTDSDGFCADEFYVILDKPYRYYEGDNLDEFVQDKAYRAYSDLNEKCRELDGQFVDFMYVKASKDIKFIQLYDSDSVSSIPRVKLCVSVDRFFNLSIAVHGQYVPFSHEIWDTLNYKCFNIRTVQKVLVELSKYDVCCGNQDPELQNLIPVGSFLDIAGEPKYQGYKEGFFIGSTIRSTSCLMLVCKKGKRCKHCNVYRRTLKKTQARKLARENIPTPEKDWTKSRVPNSRLSDSQKFEKIKQLKTANTFLELENARLGKKINKNISEDGVNLSVSESDDLLRIMEMSDKNVQNIFPDENCYQRLFWQQQLKCAKLKNSRNMRWHPMIIKWCIYLKSKSSVSYDALRNSGFVKLPSERTLFDYSSVIKKGTGFQPDVINMLINECVKLSDHQRIVGILQDEIRIKSDLVYDRYSGDLVGFVELDDISNDLLKMEEVIEKKSKKLAKYVLVVMVRGMSDNMKFPMAHFSTMGVTSDQLFCILWEAVEILELDVNLNVLFITSDGASPNRRFIRLHRDVGNDSLVYRAKNIFASINRFIYFISDPPHLLKTTRNCFSNSYSHRMTRRLWNNGKDISWLQIVDLYKDHCSGLYRTCPKLSNAHINITAFASMKVSLAAQVLSSTVANALEMHYGDQVSETVNFVRHMDKFFDCMNVRNLGEAKKKRNELLKPYTSVDDQRLDYLLNDFLDYFASWKNSVANRPGNFTKSQSSGMMLSYQTLEGLEITVRSVVSCVRFCLEQGMPFVLTEKFNQDAVEQHFGVHRSTQGCNTNPNLSQFSNSIVHLRTVGSHAIAPFRGNTRRRLELNALDDTPLPKRRRHASE